MRQVIKVLPIGCHSRTWAEPSPIAVADMFRMDGVLYVEVDTDLLPPFALPLVEVFDEAGWDMQHDVAVQAVTWAILDDPDIGCGARLVTSQPVTDIFDEGGLSDPQVDDPGTVPVDGGEAIEWVVNALGV